jgi:hypothetical protein
MIDLAQFTRRRLIEMKRDYPRMVARAVISKAQADDEIAMQEEIVTLLEIWVRMHKA